MIKIKTTMKNWNADEKKKSSTSNLVALNVKP